MPLSTLATIGPVGGYFAGAGFVIVLVALLVVFVHVVHGRR